MPTLNISDKYGDTFQVKGKKIIGVRQGAIESLIDQTGGTDAGAGGTLAEITDANNTGSADLQEVRNSISTLSGQIERILLALRIHGLIEDSIVSTQPP